MLLATVTQNPIHIGLNNEGIFLAYIPIPQKSQFLCWLSKQNNNQTPRRTKLYLSPPSTSVLARYSDGCKMAATAPRITYSHVNGESSSFS